MLWVNLNNKYNYTLKGKRFEIDNQTFRLIYSPAITIKNWGKDPFKTYLKLLKETYYFGQDRRCAFCRTRVRIGAYWEEIEHIVAQTRRGDWIFYPKNLVIACKPCNSLKNDTETRINPLTNYFPLKSSGFTVFNPHFDLWSDHFEILKGIFLRGKQGTKGPETYSKYRLYRYNVAIAYAEEKRYKTQKTSRRLTHLLRDPSLSSEQITGIKEGIDYLIKLRKHGRPNHSL